MDGGEIISVCEYEEFNHSFMTAGTTQEVILAPAIAVPTFAFIGVSVRVHARNISGAAPAGYEVVVRQSNPSRRDPADFQLVGADSATPKITNTSNPSTVPGLVNLSAPMTQIQNPYVKVLLRATALSSGSTVLWIIISVDLVCRTSG